jgi:hypothetical protein
MRNWNEMEMHVYGRHCNYEHKGKSCLKKEKQA